LTTICFHRMSPANRAAVAVAEIEADMIGRSAAVVAVADLRQRRA
jgi:hypothetical protein